VNYHLFVVSLELSFIYLCVVSLELFISCKS
jgi:hypothetical protein